MLMINKNWNSLIKPKNIIYNKNKNNPNSTDLVIEPLDRGFGLTLGNALRRVLLSSLQGAAITAIKIPGVIHEFSTKPGVKEDIVDIILNLKSVIIKMRQNDSEHIKLKVKGPKVVTASMIETNENVEILNLDAYICTISDNSVLEMDLICNVGKNYQMAPKQKENDLSEGIIRIDSLFSPVKKVSYRVENTRVAQITDYDKLILQVQTNGSVTPESAVAYAAKIMQDQLQCFINFEEIEEISEKKKELAFNPVLLKKLSHLELSVRSQNCLQNDNIIYVGDLVKQTETQMLKAPNFGRKSLNEIKNVLSRFNLTLGMTVPEWPPENIEDLTKQYEDKI